MDEALLGSIIISSYNYGRFLPEAIDSALNQTYPNIEVIVVDDGSTDNSREIIAGYGNRITPVLKENGGQASALNAGFAVSRGQVIFFLDSDDLLLPTTVANVLPFFQDPNVVKVHWPLWEIDEDGNKTGQLRPPRTPADGLAQGNLREALIRGGPLGYAWPPTSGNSWSRTFIRRIFPMPEAEYKTSPDLYLAAFAPLFGYMKRLSEPQGCWRIHRENHSWHAPIEERLERRLRRLDHCFGMLSGSCWAMAIDVDPEVWKAHRLVRWLHQIRQAIHEIAALVPPGDTFILVDDDQWAAGEDIAGRRRLPFLEQDGQYWGRPPDDATAIRELERLRQAGARFMVFVWDSFWWLDYYAGLHRHLRAQFRCVLENERLVAFDLRP